MNKKTLLSAAAAVMIASSMTGCGSSTPTTTTDTISGIAVDGYLSGATICLDINNNNACDASEPSTTSAADGSYALDITNVTEQQKQTAEVLAYGGEDTATGRPFLGVLKSPLYDDDNVNVTPLTTMVAAKVQTKAEIQAAIAEVASSLGVNEAELMEDPLKVQNKEMYQHALKIQKTIEILTEAVSAFNSTVEDDSDDFMKISEVIAGGFDGTLTDIETVFAGIDFNAIPGFENGELVRLVVGKINEIIVIGANSTTEDIQRISYMVENLRETIKQRIELAKEGGGFDNAGFDEDSLLLDIDSEKDGFNEPLEKIKRFIEAIDLDVTDAEKERVAGVLSGYQIAFTFSNTLQEYKVLIENASFNAADLATQQLLLAAINHKIADHAEL